MKKAIVFGNGISGKGAKKLLEIEKYQVILVDDSMGISSLEAEIHLDDTDIFIKSPGISFDNSLVKKALDKNIEVIDEIEFGYRYMKKYNLSTKIIAITGSNGKTTTTSKITELLQKANYKALYAGNIGVSLAEVLSEKKELDYIVLELSSFQLEGLKDFTPYISLIVNLSPDHLDRYSDVDDYYDAKFNICKNQSNDSTFIYNLNDDNTLRKLDSKVSCKTLGVTVNQGKDKAFLYDENGVVISNGEVILETSKLSLKGRHNLENALFVIAVGKLLNISNDIIKDCLYNTKTLEHRMEVFYKWGDNIFINDSKGTNLDSTSFAIEAYKNAILICGGKDKGLPLDEISKTIKNNISSIYLIGQMADRFEKALLLQNYPKENIYNLKTLENVMISLKDILSLNTDKKILLSPSTSSFDQFKSFEHRGIFFKTIVKDTFVGGDKL